MVDCKQHEGRDRLPTCPKCGNVCRDMYTLNTALRSEGFETECENCGVGLFIRGYREQATSLINGELMTCTLITFTTAIRR